MGKNKRPSRDEAPNPNSVANRETFQRLNFLYQASAYLKRIEATSAPSDDEQAEEGLSGNRARKKRRIVRLGELGSSYVRCMRGIGNKSVIRIDPNVKRTLCKGCTTILLPGTTVSVRIKGTPDKGHKVVYTCLACHTTRSIPAPPVAPLSESVIPSTVPSTVPPIIGETSAMGPSVQGQKPFDQPKMRKRPKPRPLPFFARPGHVVFRGNEMVPDR